jgi:hypothetical protein
MHVNPQDSQGTTRTQRLERERENKLWKSGQKENQALRVLFAMLGLQILFSNQSDLSISV